MKSKKLAEKHFILSYTIIFFIISLCGYIVMFRRNISMVWSIDGVGQYYPTFIYIGQYLQRFFKILFSGSIPTLQLFDLSIGMGEDIIGVLNYYGFGDPLNLLAVFVSSDNSAYLFSFMFFLRIYLSGISFLQYCYYMNLDRLVSVLGAMCYVFSGFAIYGGAMYIEWLAVLIYFPLILLGVEKIFKEQGKPYILIFSTAYGASCGFYYLYMTSLFLIVYCLVRLFAIYGIKK